MREKFIITGLLSLMTINLLAQDKLSLTDAIQIGLKNNFQIQITGKNVEIAKRNNNWMEAGVLPTISLTGGTGLYWNENNDPSSFIQGVSESSNISYGVDLDWVLFNGFRVKITKDKLAQLNLKSEGNATIAVENTIQSIVLGYYNTLLQKEKMASLTKVIEVSLDRFKYMTERKELGSASLFDLLQTKNALLTDSTNYLMQKLSYKNALRNLNMLMAIDVEHVYEPTDQLKLNETVFNLEGLKSKMLSNNQTLKNQFVNQKIMKKNKGIARANLFPTISFNSGYGESINGFEGNGVGGTRISSTGNESLNYYASVSLSFTLFNGNKSHRAFKNMQIQEKIAQLTTDEMKLTLTNELIMAYELYLARVSILKLTSKTLENIELNLKIATEKYKSGSISSFEFRDIQTAYLNTAVTQLEAVFNAVNSHTDLSRLTGGIIDEYKNIQ
jgi:outer membrane protein